MADRIESEVVLPRRVVPQPTPEIVSGGDCGACVLGGILGMKIEEVYDHFRGAREPLGWSHMRQALWDAKHRQQLDRIRCDHYQTWQSGYSAFNEWGTPGWSQAGAWFEHLTMAFDAGYYAIALVDMEKKGPRGGGTNHWCMIVGSRMRWVPFPDGKGSRGHREILVSCSSRRTPDEEWVEDSDFLYERGGFNLMFARPVEI